MNLSEFVYTYLNHKVGDGQCVALIKQYENDVLGITPEAVGNAVDYFRNFNNTPFLYNNYNLIAYTGSELPNKYDIVVFDENYGQGFGHVAIVYDNINSTMFTSFDQNWNAQVGEIITHNYNHVLGYLRPKNLKIKNKNKWLQYMAKRKRIIIK